MTTTTTTTYRPITDSEIADWTNLHRNTATDKLAALVERLYEDAADTASWCVSQGFATDMATEKVRQAALLDMVLALR